MITFHFDIGRSGNRVEQVPRCFYDFVTIYNNTRFDFTLFKGNSNLVQDMIGSCPAYTILTFPHDKLVDTVNFVWTGGGGIETAQNERCKIFFTVDNLGLVGQFRAPELAPTLPPLPVTPASSPTIFNVSMPVINTEYSLILPANTKKFTLSLQENDTLFRFAFVPGHVAGAIRPFYTVVTNSTYYEDFILSNVSIFFACPLAGRHVQIVTWR